jgi:hypothetical protein
MLFAAFDPVLKTVEKIQQRKVERRGNLNKRAMHNVHHFTVYKNSEWTCIPALKCSLLLSQLLTKSAAFSTFSVSSNVKKTLHSNREKLPFFYIAKTQICLTLC